MIKCPAFLGPEHYFTDNCNLTREVLSQYQSDLQVKENKLKRSLCQYFQNDSEECKEPSGIKDIIVQ